MMEVNIKKIGLRQSLQLLISLFLFLVFLYFTFECWDKYSQKRISTNVQEKKQKDFLYPSITVCPEKTFKNYDILLSLLLNSNWNLA